MSGRTGKPLFGQHARPYVDPLAPVFDRLADRERYAARFPAWCRPVHGQEQPWFRVDGVLYWGSVGYGCGTCRAWPEADRSRVAESAASWRRLLRQLARRHGVSVEAVEVRPNLPGWISGMSEHRDDDGSLVKIWETNDFGGHQLFARWDGFVFELYTDAQMNDCLGEVETIEDPEGWALDLLSDLGRLNGSTDGSPVMVSAGVGRRSGFGE